MAPPSRSFRSARKVSSLEEGDDTPKSIEKTDATSNAPEDSESRLSDRKSPRQDGVNGRYAHRAERGGFQNSKFRRKDDDDDQRDGERDQNRTSWRSRDRRRDDTEVGMDTRKFDSRQMDWRRNRDWNQPEKVEADPEWMDSTEVETPQVHTQEEFQQWKERMKAGGGAAQQPPQTVQPDQSPPAAAVEDKKPTKFPNTTGTRSPELDDAMEKFFARFNQPQSSAEAQNVTGKPAMKTRFASLWNAPAEALPEVVQQSAHQPDVAVQSPSTSDADQAGFARILQMLGSRSSHAPPQEPTVQKPKAPLYARAEPEFQRRMRSPESTTNFPDHDEEPRTRASRSIDPQLTSKSPNEPSHTRQESSKDTSDILLNLMRQANISQQAQQNQYQREDIHHLPGVLPMTEEFNRIATNRNNATSANTQRESQHIQPREGRVNFFDEPTSPRAQYPEKQFVMNLQQKDPRLSYSDPAIQTMYYNSLLDKLPGQFTPHQQVSASQMPNPGLPPGFQRPPGLDNMPRIQPTWSNSQSQPQPPRQAPPPGLQNLPRGMAGPFGSSGSQMPPLPPYLQNQQQQPPPSPHSNNPNQNLQRGPPQRKYTNETGIGPGLGGFPSNMGPPPPGFLGNGPPPPGFPIAGPPQNYGRYQIGEGMGTTGAGGPSQAGMGRVATGYTEFYGATAPDRNMRPGQLGSGFR